MYIVSLFSILSISDRGKNSYVYLVYLRMKTYRLVFIGTGDFGVPILENLLQDKNFEIAGIITAPDKPQGRKLLLTPTRIKEIGLLNKKIIHTPQSKKEFEEIISLIKPDICLLVAYGMILPKKILSIPKYGFINIHGSILPRYRGPSPIHQALLNGDTETGNTWIQMNEKMDEGPIIGMEKIEIEKNDTFTLLYKKLAQLAANHTSSYLLHYINLGQLIRQDDTYATYCSKIDKKDGYINFLHDTAEKIYNKFRAYIEWPNVYFKAKNMNIKIIQCNIYDQNNYSNIAPGTFIILDNKKLLIVTKVGVIELKELQPESKKIMPAYNFLQGYKNILKPLLFNNNYL